jgi:hypothetical protein
VPPGSHAGMLRRRSSRARPRGTALSAPRRRSRRRDRFGTEPFRITRKPRRGASGPADRHRRACQCARRRHGRGSRLRRFDERFVNRALPIHPNLQSLDSARSERIGDASARASVVRLLFASLRVWVCCSAPAFRSGSSMDGLTVLFAALAWCRRRGSRERRPAQPAGCRGLLYRPRLVFQPAGRSTP